MTGALRPHDLQALSTFVCIRAAQVEKRIMDLSVLQMIKTDIRSIPLIILIQLIYRYDYLMTDLLLSMQCSTCREPRSIIESSGNDFKNCSFCS